MNLQDESQKKQPLRLCLKEVTHVYHHQDEELTLFSNLSLEVPLNQTTALVGRSGSGKTTLLSILSALRKPTFGSVFLNNVLINEIKEKERAKLHNQTMGFLYQFHHLLPEFTALENIMMPILISGKNFKEAKEQAFLWLKKLELEKKEKHFPNTLSGGERQRVALARAMVMNPDFVFMDEPTGNLDPQTAILVQELILSIQKENQSSFLIITHDIPWTKQMDEVWELSNGKVSSSLSKKDKKHN